MFKTVKQQVDLLPLLSEYTGQELVGCGSETYEMSDKICPFCGHKDCFKVKHNPESLEDSFYKCFSCNEVGDVIGLVEKMEKVSSVEAAKILAKKYDIKLPSNISPLQAIFDAAAAYYSEIFESTTKAYSELNGETPAGYQVKNRNHKREVLRDLQVGWSDGGLVQSLTALGYDLDLIKESGLMNARGKDYLPYNCFIYPHKVRGRTSHFTIKDPLKKVDYQLRSRNKLNGHSFYNQDSINNAGPVIIVEGENDLISVIEAGWEGGVIASIGNLSTAQVDWLAINLSNREVVTIFDSDAAGDGYRDKVGKIANKFQVLKQVKLSGVKDIDEYLVAGGDLEGCITSTDVWSTKPSISKLMASASGSSGAGSSSPTEDDSNSSVADFGAIFEKDGCYFKWKKGKEDEYFPVLLSTFTIKRHVTYVLGDGKAEREMIFTRHDGRSSGNVIVDSDTKVSLAKFKVLVANVIDGYFMGDEKDLIAVWMFVERQESERIITVPPRVGRLDEYNGWLFSNVFIHDSGMVYKASSDNGIIWLSGGNGIKPLSAEVESGSSRDYDSKQGVPELYIGKDDIETKEFIGDLIKAISRNLNIHNKQLGDVISIFGFMWAITYSNEIFKKFGSFPILFAWGQNGRGKSTVIRWFTSLYGQLLFAETSVNKLNSGVGWGRKMDYYSSLPTFVDELRSDAEGREFNKDIRNYYDRTSKVTGMRDSAWGVRSHKIRSVSIISGQDKSADSATKERCLHFYISDNDREKVETYKWITDHAHELSSIGYYWLKNRNFQDLDEILNGIRSLRNELQIADVNARTSLCFATAGYFGNILAKTYFPDFDYMAHLKSSATNVTGEQKEENLIVDFFETAYVLLIKENSPFNSSFVAVEGNYLFVYLRGMYDEVVKYRQNANLEPFSRTAIRNALLEEEYCLNRDRPNKEIKRSMGPTADQRVIKIDLTKAPEVFNNIGSYVSSTM